MDCNSLSGIIFNPCPIMADNLMLFAIPFGIVFICVFLWGVYSGDQVCTAVSRAVGFLP